uniref:Ig-like domain-containing protein n=1 Tax=Strongyloides stercoralis TaxID=6248 RepID=A0A0K0EMF7_STRER
MKLFKTIFLLYFFNGDFTNKWQFLVEGEDEEFACSFRDDKDRVVVYKNDPSNTYSNEDVFFKIYTNEFKGKKFDTNLQVNNNATLTIKNIRVIEIPLRNLYRSGYESNFTDHVNEQINYHGIKFLYCPIDKMGNHMYHFTNYNEKNFIRKLKGPNTCNIGHCEIGLVLHKNKTNPDKLIQGGTIDYAFYIALKAEPGMALLFSETKINKDAFPLVLCPYTGWIPKFTKSSFVPSSYVNEDTIELKNDFDRHRLIPAYLESFYIGSKSSEKTRAFICGNIKQLNMDDLPVGFKLFESSYSTSKSSVKIDNDKILCNGEDVSDAYLFGFLNNTYNIDSDVPMMKYLINDYKFYSDQIIYAYDKKRILDERYAAANIKDFESRDSLFDNFYFNSPVIYYTPMCYGKIYGKSAVLKPKVSNVVQKESDEMVFKIANQGVNAGSKISCYAVVDNDYNGKFSEFYAKRYKTKIQRIKDSKGVPVSEDKAYEIPINDDAEKFYGTYKCELENPGSDNMIIEKEFIILPSDAYHNKKVVYMSSKDKNVLKCNLKSIDNLELSEVKVDIGSENNLTFNYFKKEEPNEIFKLKKDYVTYNVPSLNDFKNGTIISCIYGLPGGNTSLYETTYYLTDLIPTSNGLSSKTIFIIVGCIAGSLIVLIIITVIIIIILKKKKSKQLKKLSRMSGSLSSHSLSAQSLSSQSLSSQSSSKKNKNKKSRFTRSTSSTSRSSSSTSKSNSKSGSISTSNSKNKRSRNF